MNKSDGYKHLKNDLSMQYDKEIEKYSLKLLKKWHAKGITPEKDTKMSLSQENFYRVIAMRDEIIFEQKEEIAKLKSQLNKLELKLQSKKVMIENMLNKLDLKE